MQAGSEVRFWRQLGERFRETIIGDIFVTIATAVVALIYTNDWRTSMASGLAALLALFLWLIIEALSHKVRYRYEDV